MNKIFFHHNKADYVSEYEITIIIDEHVLFSTISADWILDFRAIKHVYCNKTYFDHLEFYKSRVAVGSDWKQFFSSDPTKNKNESDPIQ